MCEPVKTFRAGDIEARVWCSRTRGMGISLARHYTDKRGRSKVGRTLRPEDLPDILTALGQACEFARQRTRGEVA